jgi:hypothetical protein
LIHFIKMFSFEDRNILSVKATVRDYRNLPPAALILTLVNFLIIAVGSLCFQRAFSTSRNHVFILIKDAMRPAL